MTRDLRAGDVLSYSAGTTNTGPDGFRFLRRAGVLAGADMLGAVAARWPGLLEVLGDGPPVVINGYPAATADFSFGVAVDSYLSVPVALRALRLARDEGLCAIVIAQPLWLAELVVEATSAPEPTLPDRMVAAVGGYPLPGSLEAFAIDACAAAGSALHVVQLYGMAEVDSGCLVGRDRDVDGLTVFHARDDVRISGSGAELLLSRRSLDGTWSTPMSTGDRFRLVGASEDDGIVIPLGTRVLAGPWEVLESWDDAGWRRRTGHLRRHHDGLLAQLRPGLVPEVPGPMTGERWAEEEHFDFARATGASSLRKPDWRCEPI